VTDSSAPPAQSQSWKRYWDFVHRVDPGIRSPFDRYADWVVERARTGGRWLDAGCGRHSLPEWRMGDMASIEAAGTTIIGCDLDLAALHDRQSDDAVCLSTLDALPYRSESFSLVSSNMVFEHLAHPELSVAELVRVTRPGGRIIVHTVNRRYYTALLARATPHAFHEWIVEKVEGRAAKDVYPTLYRANTVADLAGLFARQGASVVRGGLIDGIPRHIPYKALFWPSIAAGLAELQLGRVPGLSLMLKPNLLMEFQRN